MDAYDLTAYESNRSVSVNGLTFCFGIDPAATAATLRELANKIERREVSLSSGRFVTFANHRDFSSTVMRLVFSELRSAERAKEFSARSVEGARQAFATENK